MSGRKKGAAVGTISSMILAELVGDPLFYVGSLCDEDLSVNARRPLNSASSTAVLRRCFFLPPGLFPLCGGSYEGLWEILYAHGGHAGLLVRCPILYVSIAIQIVPVFQTISLGVSADLVLKLRSLFRVPGAHGLEKAVMEERKKKPYHPCTGGA